MTDQFAVLREALAAGPTPGPWKKGRSFEIGPVSHADDQSFGMIIPLADAYGENKDADALYIAAANPATITALLAERDAQAAEIEQLREALKTISDWQAPNVLARGELVSMRVALGSNGERDWFRGIAGAALSQGEPNASNPTAHG